MRSLEAARSPRQEPLRDLDTRRAVLGRPVELPRADFEPGQVPIQLPRSSDVGTMTTWNEASSAPVN